MALGATAASALAAVVSLVFTEVHVVARAFHNGKVPVDFHRAALNLGVSYHGHDLMRRDELSSCCSSADVVVSTLPSGALDAHVSRYRNVSRTVNTRCLWGRHACVSGANAI